MRWAAVAMLVAAGCAETSTETSQALAEEGPQGPPGARGPRGLPGRDAVARVYMRRAFFGEPAMCDEGDAATGGTCSSEGAYFSGPEVDDEGMPVGWSCDAELDANGQPTTSSVVCLSLEEE